MAVINGKIETKTPEKIIPQDGIKVTQAKRTSQMSKQERLAYAKAHGLSAAQAEQFANTDRTNTYSDTFWDRFRRFFGGKLGSESMQESLDLADTALLNELLNAQREQDYNDPAAQNERLRAAGLNPDLTGGEMLSPGESSQIDDEVLGSGLNESLSSAQQSAIDLPMQVASGIMDAAGAVFSLVGSGVDLSTKIYDLEAREMSDVFNLAKGMNDLGSFLPMLGIQYDDVNKTFFDDHGEVTIEHVSERAKQQLLKEKARYLHPRSRRKVSQLFDYLLSSKSLESFLASKTGERKQTLGYAEAGKGLAELAGSAGITMQQLLASPSYKETCDLAANLYKLSIQAQIHMQEYQSQYYSDLNSPDAAGWTGATEKAAAERLENQRKQYQDTIRKQVYEELYAWVDKLSKSDDAISEFLLMSAMSGGFQQLGFGSPYDLASEALDRVGGIADFLTDIFLPQKALGKAAGKAVSGAKSAKKVKPSSVQAEP